MMVVEKCSNQPYKVEGHPEIIKPLALKIKLKLK